jgi:uncharacterized protein (DUF983 family)
MKLQQDRSREQARNIRYVLLYHNGLDNTCPSCGQHHWFIGRVMAECAFCETALPLAQNLSGGVGRRFTVSAAAA